MSPLYLVSSTALRMTKMRLWKIGDRRGGAAKSYLAQYEQRKPKPPYAMKNEAATKIFMPRGKDDRYDYEQEA